MKQHISQTSDTSDAAKTPWVQGSFNELIPELQRAVAAEGYVRPTPVQEQSIPHLLAKRDLLGCAQTGTGKTAAFALPLLQQLADTAGRPQKGKPRALVLAPTRELAAQIGKSIQTYGRFLRLSHTVVCGGVKQAPQVKALSRGVDILVATPGRLLDLMQQKHIHLNKVQTFILDEMDRMLDMGFLPDIQRVLTHLPQERQTLFFSATINNKMTTIAGTMVQNPVHVNITPDKPAVDQITQKVCFLDKSNKNSLLISLLNDPRLDKVLIFTQMKHVANRVAQKLNAQGIRGAAIHGDKSQHARTKTLDGFRKNRFKVLVATDVAARGLDVDDITHVINYDLPGEAEVYIHRIGRTARAGAEGNAISFCCADDRRYLKDIERILGDSIPSDTEHTYHCEQALKVARSDGKTNPRQKGNRSYGRRSQGGRIRYRSRPRR